MTQGTTPHFHNTGLEMLMSLGIVGLIAYLGVTASSATILGNTTIDISDRNLLAAILSLFLISAAFDYTLMKHITFSTTFLAYVCVAAQRVYR